METLQRLTRRQLEALQAVRVRETREKGVPLKQIATALRLTPPAALEHLTALEHLSLVDRYRGKSRLSSRGRATLAEYQRHHRLAETLFGRLGLSADRSCRAAREIDLAISHSTVEELCRLQEHPAECPHGAPIRSCSAQGAPGSRAAR